MKRDLEQKFFDLDGLPIKAPKQTADAPDVVLTLKEVCLAGCIGVTPTDHGASAEQKIKQWKMAQRLHKGGIIDLTKDDLVLLHERVNAAWPSPIVVGIAAEMLDTDYVPPADAGHIADIAALPANRPDAPQ